MGTNWKTKSLKDLSIFLSRGVTPSYTESDGIRVLNQKCIRDQTVNFAPARRTDTTKKNVSEDKILKVNDILINSTGEGTLGRVAQIKIISEPTTVDSHVTILRPNPFEVDPSFLGCVVRHLQPEIEMMAEGSTGQTELSRTRLGSLEIELPSTNEQRQIASILGAFDEKIAVNQRMNATLEAMARSLFQSWFVDFDPVRAKLDGSKPVGIDEPTAKLFPDTFQDSELGNIPKGWRAGTLSEDFKITMGQSPPGNTYNESGDGLPFYQGCTDFGFRFPKHRIYCTAPNRTAKDRDTLVSVRAPVGDINMAKEECCIGRGVAAVRHNSGASSFTYHSIANLYPVFAKFEGEGTVFGSINKDSFERLPFVIPPAEIVSAFERIAKPLDEQIRILVEHSQALASIRNTILPKLLNGELNVENLQP